MKEKNNPATIREVINNNGPELMRCMKVDHMFERHSVAKMVIQDYTLKNCQVGPYVHKE